MKIANDVNLWTVNQDWIAISSAKVGKVLCVPSAWQEFIETNLGCEPTDYFDQGQTELLIKYGIIQAENDRDGLRDVYAEIQPRIKNNERLDNLSLIISEGCNFKCPHCIHSNDVKQLQTRSLNTYMSSDTAKLSIDSFFAIAEKNEKREIDIEFGAAEPLLNWLVIEYVVDYIKNNYSSFSVTYHMTTNLSLATEKQAKFFVENKFKISTSLDGDKLANNAVRIDKRGAGTYDTIIEKIELMKENGYSFDSVNLTLTKDNIEIINVEEYLDTIQSMGMNGIGLDFDVVTSEHLDVQTVCNKMLEIYDACKRRGLYCVGTWLHPSENMLDPDFSVPNIFCKAVAGRNLSVSPQGTLHMCDFTSTQLGRIEQVDSYGENLGNLIAGRENFVATHCQDCSLKASCRGQCHTTLEVNDPKNNEKLHFMCDFYRTLTKAVVVRSLNEQVRNER
ncbi:radical SAM/SPASM domain-containing protein [Microcoleus sp. herbarium5]|uniref:radical SAM/SPASM domain-containing protein n=1 Tax=Microcoleus sp. herbarium5 TaxID=3055434 RepID=UPI002FD09488